MNGNGLLRLMEAPERPPCVRRAEIRDRGRGAVDRYARLAWLDAMERAALDHDAARDGGRP